MYLRHTSDFDVLRVELRVFRGRVSSWAFTELRIDFEYIGVLVCSREVVGIFWRWSSCLLQAREVHVGRIESDPRRSEHEVNVSLVAVSPEFEHLFEIELGNNFMCGQHSIHVCLQPEVCVNWTLIEFDFHKTVWICSDDEVDFSPIYHNNLLDVVHYIR